ncbi:MAG: chromosome segregation protein SMC, partial [Chitinophagaceae bacterium]|nr:chromosome segregation protein SMC [Chitinophagaceae bacterium]
KEEKQKQLHLKRIDLEQLHQYHYKTKEQIQQTQSVLQNLQNQLSEENRKLDAKRNEYDLLKCLIDSMEGYPESVKFLHNNEKWHHTAPILSDIIYVQEEFRAAVENVLEPYLNYYVVNNVQEGLQAIHLLDENKKGKANFFLLDKIQQSVVLVPDHKPIGTIPALNVIEVDEKYRKLAEQLLGSVFIAEDELALLNSNGFVILEKHGKYVKGSFMLSGGSVGLFEGRKIGRAKNLEKLHDEIVAQQAVVDGLAAQIQERQNEMIAFNAELKEQLIRETDQEIRQLTNELFALQSRIENFHHLQTQSEVRFQSLQQQLHQDQASNESIRSELLSVNTTVADYSVQLQKVEAEYLAIEAEYNEINTNYNNFNLQVIRQQSKLSALKQEMQYKKNQLEELQMQVRNNEQLLEETSSNINESNQNLHDIEEKLIELLRTKQHEEQVLNETDQAYYNLRNYLNERESELRHVVKEKEHAEHLLATIKDKLNELKLQLAAMRERLNVEFKINLEDILDAARTTELSLEELQERSDRMKKRLENLGEVNPTAIEAFDEMKKRYEFIVEQKNDLVTAKHSLLQTIAEVETTANQKFLETFNTVRENFQKVFKALFTQDDQCDLVLENPENLAETGIDIIAKPKGKRPTSINQLSGGERTLTATALLFAIYLIKPAPFCILDEVDAPLDDANISKFTNMIREFSGNSQFIIVTHNKMTMSAVDVIYGVTMQEPGVSKLVSVDFRNLN